MLEIKHTINTNDNKYLSIYLYISIYISLYIFIYLYSSFLCPYQAICHKEESNLTNKDAEMQMISKKITYNAVSAAAKKPSVS